MEKLPSKLLNNYDSIMVSCQKYKGGLLDSGFVGNLYPVYPHVDPNDFDKPSRSKVNEFCQKYGIEKEDQIISVIARLDPMKGQDVAINGLAQISKKHPRAKLLLIGDGSFSSSKKGGLGLPKGLRWKGKLENLASDVGIGKRIIFTGFISNEDLEAALTRTDMLVLPSVLEGFGLTVLEGWLYRKPAVVSSGEGAAELIDDGVNGYTFNHSSDEELAEKMDGVLSKPEHAKRLGERGYETSKRRHLERGSEKIRKIFDEILST